LSERKYIFTDADKHHVHAYAIEPHSQLRLVSTTFGQIAAVREETGLMIIRIQTKQGDKYRIYFADVRLAIQEVYNDFQVLGCGLMEVKSQQKWLSLFDDGSVVPERYYPLSC
jgi:putative component of toxin-antitoxin plasmid stabilization module